MIFNMRVRYIEDEENGNDLFHLVKVPIKDEYIVGIWTTPEYDEMHVYTTGGEAIFEYNEVLYNKVVELTGNNLEENRGIS